MAINPNIALQVRAPQFEDPTNQLAKLMQVQGLQQEQGLNRLRADEYRMKMDDAQRGRERQNKLLALTQGWGADVTPEQRISGLQSGGFFDEADKLETSFQNRRKTDAEIADKTGAAKKRDFDVAKERYTIYQTALGALSREPNLSRELVLQTGAGLVSQGILPREMFEQAVANLPDDPEQLRARLTQGLRTQLSPEQMLTLFAPKPTEVSDGQVKFLRDTNPNSPSFGQQVGGAPIQMRPTPEAMLTDERTRSEGALGRGVQVRGQNMVDARARESNASAVSKPFEVTGPDGTPVLVRQDKKGNITRVEGFGPKAGAGGGKPLTEGQAKANIFGSRMTESHRILSELEDKGVTNPGLIKGAMEGVAGLTPFMGDKVSDAVGSAMNVLPGFAGGPSEDQQMVGQARRDFINAVLRRESGAVIAPSEFSNADRQYFPQPGDSKRVIDQKRRNRETAIRGMEAEMPGGALRSVPTPPTRESSGKVSDLMSEADRIIAGEN